MRGRMAIWLSCREVINMLGLAIWLSYREVMATLDTLMLGTI